MGSESQAQFQTKVEPEIRRESPWQSLGAWVGVEENDLVLLSLLNFEPRCVGVGFGRATSGSERDHDNIPTTFCASIERNVLPTTFAGKIEFDRTHRRWLSKLAPTTHLLHILADTRCCLLGTFKLSSGLHSRNSKFANKGAPSASEATLLAQDALELMYALRPGIDPNDRPRAVTNEPLHHVWIHNSSFTGSFTSLAARIPSSSRSSASPWRPKKGKCAHLMRIDTEDLPTTRRHVRQVDCAHHTQAPSCCYSPFPSIDLLTLFPVPVKGPHYVHGWNGKMLAKVKIAQVVQMAQLLVRRSYNGLATELGMQQQTFGLLRKWVKSVEYGQVKSSQSVGQVKSSQSSQVKSNRVYQSINSGIQALRGVSLFRTTTMVRISHAARGKASVFRGGEMIEGPLPLDFCWETLEYIDTGPPSTLLSTSVHRRAGP
ncbi:hypothetical protein C8F04DRAFT_1193653 [Mycena alexandri]|uniref:Uncharacterized protein n=1 Tax=Mycena alexandri TaxID=1745969 RepID=A0AAD6S8M4_9AGAR|nr:hypothetical protein C8F04DRAFT_1193653 [Mycena alexandri]